MTLLIIGHMSTGVTNTNPVGQYNNNTKSTVSVPLYADLIRT